MARIKYSALVSDMRNKLNGSVLSANRAGSYIRNKVTPVNPQTQYQQAQRQLLGSLSSAWRGLTESQRASWRAATESFPYTDIFGDQKKLDGKALFIKLNSNLSNIGVSRIDNAPLPAGVPVLGVSNFDALIAGSGSPADIVFSINTAGVPAGHKLVVYATPPINPGRNFVKNQFRMIGFSSTNTTSVDITNDYIDRFGEPGQSDVGKTIHVRAALVNETTGEMGVSVGASTVIASP